MMRTTSWEGNPGVGGLNPGVPPGFRGIYSPPWNPDRGNHGARYPPPPKWPSPGKKFLSVNTSGVCPKAHTGGGKEGGAQIRTNLRIDQGGDPCRGGNPNHRARTGARAAQSATPEPKPRWKGGWARPRRAQHRTRQREESEVASSSLGSMFLSWMVA